MPLFLMETFLLSIFMWCLTAGSEVPFHVSVDRDTERDFYTVGLRHIHSQHSMYENVINP